jgi:hypothetical protein
LGVLLAGYESGDDVAVWIGCSFAYSSNSLVGVDNLLEWWYGIPVVPVRFLKPEERENSPK